MDKFGVELAVFGAYVFGVCGLQPALTTKKDPGLTTRLVVVDFLSQEFARLHLASRFCACRGSARQRIDRVAISDSRIVSVTDEVVVYKVKPSGATQWKTRRCTGEQFVRWFSQHVLPSGFQKIRYFGFMSPNSKVQLANVRWLVWLYKGWTYWIGSGMFQPVIAKPIPTCSECGGQLELLRITNEQGRTIWQKALPKRGPP